MDASDAMAVCELSSLDDGALFELLDRVPLGSLLRMGRVNWRFRGLVKRNLLVRRQLRIIIGCGCCSKFKFNSIAVAHFDRLAVERILELLPGITSLEIINKSDSSDVLDELLYLLECWANQLEKLDVSLEQEIEPSFIALPLFGLINRMHKLKKLRFVYQGSLADTDWTALHLPVISQLQKFVISTFNEARPVLGQLRTHATNKLTKVDLWCPFYDLESSTLLLDVEPHLANGFSSLYLLPVDMSFHHLTTIFQRYKSIHIFGTLLHLLSVGQMNRAMAMLSQLTTVVMYVDFPSRKAVRQDAAILLGEELEPDTVDGSQLVPLPGVTKLTLALTLATHADFEMLHLSVLYPSLVDLDFRHLGCRTCGYHFDDDDLEASRRCLLQLQSKATFSKMFPKLRHVTYLEETLPKEDWHPEPPMPRPLFYLAVTIYFGAIIYRDFGRQLTESATGQVVAKTASQGLLAVTKAFKLVCNSMQSTIGFTRK